MRNVLSFLCRHRSRKNLPKGLWNGGYEVSVAYMILHQRTKKIEPPANPTTPKLDPKPFVSSRWNGKRECAKMLSSGELLWNVRERVPRLGGLGAVAGLELRDNVTSPSLRYLEYTWLRNDLERRENDYCMSRILWRGRRKRAMFLLQPSCQWDWNAGDLYSCKHWVQNKQVDRSKKQRNFVEKSRIWSCRAPYERV